MANQTIIALDLSSSTVTSVTLSDYYAPKADPVLTGTVNIGGATSVSLPTNTTIGSVSSTELGYLDGVTSNIQSQLSTISLSGSVTGNVILPTYVANSAGAIVFEGSTADNNQLFLVPTDPVADVYLTLPAITDTVVTKTTTDTFTNKTFDTSGTGNVFRVNGAALTATTGTGSTVVLSTSPTITTPTLAGQVQATTGMQVANYLDVKRPNGNIAFNLYATNSVAQIGSAGDAASIEFIKPIVTSDITVNGNLSVNGTTTTINTATLTVDDKLIELGDVASPTNTTANGGGITLKGTTDKTILWDSTNANWTSSENWNIASGKTLKINNVTLLDTNAPKSMATLMGFTSTATAGGITTLTNTSSYYQQFTGSSSQFVALPVTSTLITGWTFHIVNNSTSTIIVQTDTGISLTNSLPSGTTLMCTCVNTGGTGASSEWEFGITDFSTFTGTGAVVMATSPTFSTRIALSGNILNTSQTAVTGATTVTGAIILNKNIHLSTASTAVAFTLDTGTNIDTAFGAPANGSTIEWSIINSGTGTATITVGSAAGHTISGTATVNIASAANFITRKVATNSYATFRLS